MSNDSVRNAWRRRLRALGRSVVKGPDSLLPPSGDPGDVYLAPQLSIYLNLLDHSAYESAVIYVDVSTMEGDGGYHFPVVRHAHWEVGAQARDACWPNVRIQFGQLRERLDEVDGMVLRLAGLLANSQAFVPSKIMPMACSPGVPVDVDKPEFTVRLSNAWQDSEFKSPALQDDELTECVLHGFSLINSVAQSISRAGWVEEYEIDLRAPDSWRSWRWDGVSPSS